MKKFIAMFLFLIPSQVYGSCDDAINTVYKSTVEVILSDRDGPVYGTGFVYNNYIITNSHVVNLGNNPIIKLPSGIKKRASVVIDDKEHDIAILKVFGDIPQTVQISNNNTNHVIAIGNANGNGLSVFHGNIKEYNQNIRIYNQELSGIIKTSIQATFGVSGAPVFNCNGQVIGIANSIIPRANGLVDGYVIPISQVENIIPYENNPRIGVMLLDDLKVNEVFPETPAALAGINEGDVFLSLNGTPIESVIDLKEKIKNQSKINLTILRGNSKISLKIKLI